jgi:hypothetical protein
MNMMKLFQKKVLPVIMRVSLCMPFVNAQTPPSTEPDMRDLLAAFRTMSVNNYQLEKYESGETKKYLELEAFDTDKNNVIDLKEFRSIYLRGKGMQKIPQTLSDENCQATSAILNADECDDPATLEGAYRYLLDHKTTINDIHISIALDKKQPNMRQYFNAMLVYGKGVDENTGDQILDRLFSIAEDAYEPAAALYAIDFIFYQRRYLRMDEYISPIYYNILKRTLNTSYIKGKPLYMEKAARVFSSVFGVGPEALPAVPTFGAMAMALYELGGGNLVIETSKPNEQKAYVEYQKLDVNKDGKIEPLEFRDDFLRRHKLTSIPLNFGNERCQKLTSLFSDDPPLQAMEKVLKNTELYNEYSGLSPQDADYMNVLIAAVQDERRPPAVCMIMLEALFNHQRLLLDEDVWQNLIYNKLDAFLQNPRNPALYILSNYLWSMEFRWGGIFTLEKGTAEILESMKALPEIKAAPDLLKKINEMLKENK